MVSLKRIGLNSTFIASIIAVLFISGCTQEALPPAEVPEGILVSGIPGNADILFVSMRYILDDSACLDNNYNVKKNFINDLACNAKIYNAELDVLAAPRQLYALDIETGETVQITNIACDFSSSKPISSTKIMAAGMCSDTDGDGIISTKDKPEIYIIDLAGNKTECLSCRLNLTAINNPDYSQANGKIIFSAQKSDKFHNYLFTLDLEKNLMQITDSEDYMDFDCSWSEDGKKIVFNRLPTPFFSEPSVIWLMDADGSNKEQITYGGPNPDNEEPQGLYPIGLDADPDLSPDNSEIIFSRLKTGRQNEPFGVYELAVVDVATKEITKLDSNYANMIPEWKEQGILFIRQIGSDSLMGRKQSMYIYNGDFVNLEPDHDVFPIGSNGASWIE
jgi:Tol biopolymer transport system component